MGFLSEFNFFLIFAAVLSYESIKCTCPAQPHCLSVFSSVQFSRSVVSDSLQPHESQHTRPPCPSPPPGVHSNSCPSCWWCHPPSHPLSSPSPPAPNPSQHQSLFQWDQKRCMIWFQYFKIYWDLICGSVCDWFLENVPCVLEKNLYSAFGWNVICIYIY